MKKKAQKSRVSLQPFLEGQIWRMEGSNLQIGMVGKTLVHYKHYKGETKRSPISLTNKGTLEKFLQEKQAILVQE